jgi:chromosome segregation ATPase
VSPLTKEDIHTIQELIKAEVEILFKPILESLKDISRALSELKARTEENTKAIAELRLAIAELRSRTEENTKAIAELRMIAEENTKAIIELRARTEENTKAIVELRSRTEENTKAIAELRLAISELKVRTEENTKAIAELRARTEENTKAIIELRARTEENTKAIAELRKTIEEMSKILLSHDIALRRLRKEVGGLGRSIGSLLEDNVRRGLRNWLIAKGYAIDHLEPKIIDEIEFDLYIEAIKDNRRLKVIGEIKQTITPRKVEKFALKLEKLSMKDFEPLMIFKRIKKKKEVVEKAKMKKIYLLYHLGNDVFVSYQLGDLF